jgi:hypothetical protein
LSMTDFSNFKFVSSLSTWKKKKIFVSFRFISFGSIDYCILSETCS